MHSLIPNHLNLLYSSKTLRTQENIYIVTRNILMVLISKSIFTSKVHKF